jgi:hypothetical protein
LLIKCLFIQLNITPGQKGLVKLTGDVPSWINFQDREKVKVMAAAGCLAVNQL